MLKLYPNQTHGSIMQIMTQLQLNDKFFEELNHQLS